MGILCEIVRDQLVPSADIKVTSKMTLKQRQREMEPVMAALAVETLGLFEALCWTAPDGQEIRYFTHSLEIGVSPDSLSGWLLSFEGTKS